MGTSFSPALGTAAAKNVGTEPGQLPMALIPLGCMDFDKTIIPAGTTGNVAIETPLWQVNFAADTSSLQITSSLVKSTTLVLTNVATNNDDLLTIIATCVDGVCTLRAKPTQPTVEIAVQGMFL